MQQPDKTFVLYKKTITLDFWEKPHKYIVRETGLRPISVSTACGVVDKSRPLIIWATKLANSFLKDLLEQGAPITAEQIDLATTQHQIKKEAAADAGTLVHKYAEEYISGKNPELPKDEKVLNGVTAFLKWVKENDVKFKESERMVYSKKHDYVGTLDAVGVLKGKTSLIDFKTSGGIYSTMHYQVAAYQMAYEEETGKELSGPRYIVRFDKETGEFHVVNLDEDDKNYKKDRQAFLAALTLKKREKELSTWGD